MTQPEENKVVQSVLSALAKTGESDRRIAALKKDGISWGSLEHLVIPPLVSYAEEQKTRALFQSPEIAAYVERTDGNTQEAFELLKEFHMTDAHPITRINNRLLDSLVNRNSLLHIVAISVNLAKHRIDVDEFLDLLVRTVGEVCEFKFTLPDDRADAQSRRDYDCE